MESLRTEVEAQLVSSPRICLLYLSLRVSLSLTSREMVVAGPAGTCLDGG